MNPRVVIVGGGVIGSAIAYFLTARPGWAERVTVIERDPAYRQASSALSASSIRQQFSAPVNIRIGQFGIEFLRRVGTTLAVEGDRPEIGLVEPGYLYLVPPDGAATLRRVNAIQRAHGAEIALLEPAEVARRFPWLSIEGVALASLGLSGEGWFDGPALMQAFRRKARRQGARYVTAEAAGFEMAGDTVRAVRLADGGRLDCDMAVNAAGPWAARVAAWAGIDLPVRARRRTVFVLSSPDKLAGCPLTIDPSGLWFRPEAAHFLCGISPPAAEDHDDLPLEPDHAPFEETVWPILAGRVPAFERLRVVNAWAGYYEYNTFDQNGLVGFHPACRNLIFANGFSGHGIQQAPAVGEGVAALIATGRFGAVDLGDLSPARLAANRPLLEENVIG